MKRKTYILLSLFVITFVVAMVSLPDSTKTEEVACVEENVPLGEEMESFSSGISAAAGMLSEAPQVPQTVPVRRVVTTTTSGSAFSLSRIIRLCHNLSMRQLALASDRILASLCSVHSSVFAGAPAPYNVTRACEYYVYALRVIVI